MNRFSLGQCSGVITCRSSVCRYRILFTTRNKLLGGSSEPGSVLFRDFVLLARLAVLLLAKDNGSSEKCSDYVPITRLAVYQQTTGGGLSGPGPMLWCDVNPLTRFCGINIIGQ